MRLTLRTLLAWMDDTLQPDQVREIGTQVAESPFAGDLKERIQRVTRQRRLSVPGSSGPDATDPNVVSAYLDNDLDPDEVSEFEKRCLTSDVNLAEVASVHQILSLLGQKVKVPAEARTRMYQLVKGRESAAARRRSSSKRPAKEPVTRPIQPWAMPEVPRRPWIERYGPALACLVLILISGWAMRESLRPSKAQTAMPGPRTAIVNATTVPESDALTTAGAPTAVETTVKTGAEAATPAPSTAVTPPPPTSDLMAANTSPAPTAKPASGEPTAKAEPADQAALKKGETPPTPTVPAGTSAMAEKSNGVLLRYNDDRRAWERLEKETTLKTSDRILCLEPFRAAIDVGKLKVDLIHQTEIRILSKGSDEIPAIQLIQGRIVVRSPAVEKFKVVFAGRAVTVAMGPESEFGIERAILDFGDGRPVTEPASLGILCQRGEMTLNVDGQRNTLKRTGAALINPTGDVQTVPNRPLPPWLANAEPSAIESQIRDEFLKLFHPGRPVLAEVVSALEDERKEIKPLAVAAIQALGDLSLLLPTLSRPDDPTARRAAITAIRAYMRHDPESSDRVRAALDREFGADLGGFAQHMLLGFTPDETGKPELYIRLVGLLAADQESIGLRELALQSLKELTGRDDLGYNPDQPDGKGFRAWAELLQKGQLGGAAPGRAARTR